MALKVQMLTTRHWTGTIDAELKYALGHERTWDVAARLMAERSAEDRTRLSATQAVDIVRGGVEVSALPEEAHAIVNHRISVDDSIGRIQGRSLPDPAEAGGCEV
ncbi:hypothetical protein FB451DRAFT_1273763 [Mycena latifolia]|nr:hypothetical protein FB451DRAFT_1273763 [Mycena latifolia]